MQDRYHRQTLLPWIGEAGQAKLRAARVLLVGCGALGTHIADHLVRAGVGELRIVDRDIVEATNLQRQCLFTEAHAEGAIPKAQAAKEVLASINREVLIDAHVCDFNAGNAHELAEGCDVLLDGTDNYPTRFLLNDLSVALGIPYVYAGVVGMSGTVYPILTHIKDASWAEIAGPCLRCIMPEVPSPAAMPTCDTAGVAGPAVGIVASYAAMEGMKIMTQQWGLVNRSMMSFDFAANSIQQIDMGQGRDEACICCAEHNYEFLDAKQGGGSSNLCGRNTIQILPATQAAMDFEKLASTLAGVNKVSFNKFRLQATVEKAGEQYDLVVFADGRALVQGTDDVNLANSIYAQYVGC